MNRNEVCQVFLDFPSHSSRMVGLAVLATLLMIVVAPGVAQIPDKFENLKVLPKDMTKPELMDIMKGFSSALDVRCVNCHVGDEEKGFSSFDFQSDEKALKEKAPSNDAHGKGDQQ
ncbi:MAG: hypothetical protein ACE5GA_06520 [Candidatus Zixiibacteriota bacterium]